MKKTFLRAMSIRSETRNSCLQIFILDKIVHHCFNLFFFIRYLNNTKNNKFNLFFKINYYLFQN